MARITVEDCLKHIPNRFLLVEEATKRARQLSFEGAESLIPWKEDKATVVALREIAAGKFVKDLVTENTSESGSGASLVEQPEAQSAAQPEEKLEGKSEE